MNGAICWALGVPGPRTLSSRALITSKDSKTCLDIPRWTNLPRWFQRKTYGSIAELERAGHDSHCTMRIRPASVRPFCFVRNPQRHRSQSGKKGAAKWNHTNRQSLKRTLESIAAKQFWHIWTTWNPLKPGSLQALPIRQEDHDHNHQRLENAKGRSLQSLPSLHFFPWCWAERATTTRFGLKRRPVDHLSHWWWSSVSRSGRATVHCWVQLPFRVGEYSVENGLLNGWTYWENLDHCGLGLTGFTSRSTSWKPILQDQTLRESFWIGQRYWACIARHRSQFSAR